MEEALSDFIHHFFIAFNRVCAGKKIWALGDGEKVFREDQDHPGKNGNFTWDGTTIHLKALYNEVLAFQIIVETGLPGAKSLELSVDAPLHKPSGKTIGGNTLKYGPGGTIEVFTEHYLHVTDSTLPNWYYGSPAAAPKKMTGWIPDALIPTDALPGKGGFPVDVATLDTSHLLNKMYRFKTRDSGWIFPYHVIKKIIPRVFIIAGSRCSRWGSLSKKFRWNSLYYRNICLMKIIPMYGCLPRIIIRIIPGYHAAR